MDSSANIYLAGFTYSFGAGSGDIVLVKYKSSGEQQWYRTWGGIDDDRADDMDVAIKADFTFRTSGGYYLETLSGEEIKVPRDKIKK